MNLIAITGRLGKDAETRQAGNTTVASFSVAVTSGYGEKEKTSWVRCNLWGKRAEGGLIQYLVKGAQVAISGEFSLNEYESSGEKRTSLEVNVGSLDLIGGKSEPQQQSPAPAAPQDEQPAMGGGQSAIDSDIPFNKVDWRI